MASLGVAIVREDQRGVVFRLGKIRKVREPGMRFMIPLVDRLQVAYVAEAIVVLLATDAVPQQPSAPSRQ